MGNILSVIVINIIQNINNQYQEYYYMDAGIYGIKNKINGELIYIGSSVNIDVRINQHLNNVKNEVNQEIYNKIIDIGINNIEFIVLQDNIKCNSTSELRKIEQKYITENNIKSLYNSVNSSCDINNYNYYNYSYIYKIINKIDDRILYVGSTCLDISKRISCHEEKIRNNGKSKLYRKIKQIGANNIEFQVIEEFYCFNEIQLYQREFNWINYYFPKYNTPYNLSKYIIINGYECLEKKEMKDYNLEIDSFPNKKFQCLCGGSYIRDGLSHHSYTKKCTEYRIKNNLPIIEKKQIICVICNEPYTKSKKKQHESSEKHQECLRHQGKENFEDLIDQFEKLKIEEKNLKLFYCEICNIEVKLANKWYHLHKSPTHKKNMEK